jgi:hypothetical protein
VGRGRDPEHPDVSVSEAGALVRSLQLLLEACAAIVQTFAQKYARRTSTRREHQLQDLDAGAAIVHEFEAGAPAVDQAAEIPHIEVAPCRRSALLVNCWAS